MSTGIDIDPTIKQALKFLHSPSPDSAKKIRLLLDEIMKQRYGSRKTLTSTLSKKIVEEESSVPGTSTKRRESDDKKAVAAIPSTSKTVSSPPAPEMMETSEQASLSVNISDATEEENLKEFGDLACVVCGGFAVTAGNRLVECSECCSLYHQECHKIAILDDDINDEDCAWSCIDCKTKTLLVKPSVSSPEKSSSSSSSYEKPYSKSSYEHSPSSSSAKNKSSSSTKAVGSSSGSKSPFSNLLGSSSSTSTGNMTSSKSSSPSSSSSVTPNINIISADQRLQIIKKKAAKQLESKRKHK